MKVFKLTLTVALVMACSGVLSKETPKDGKDKNILGALIGNYKPSKEKAVGKILEGALQNVHLTKRVLDDDLSKDAFKVYLERIDFGKQFLLQSDVDKLRKYDDKFDDQIKLGDLSVIKITTAIMQERIPMVSSFVEKLLEKDFDFTKKEEYETDAEKTDYVSNEEELGERWRKMMKLQVLIQYIDLKNEQEGKNQDENKKKKKKKKKKLAKKKLSKKELMKKSREKVAKRYKKVFKRLWEEKRSDKLDKFYNSVAKIYDPHTHYFLPEEKEDFDIDMSGKLEGIGALLREEDSYIKVERVIPGSASWKGKELKAEDIILSVAQADGDPVSIVDMSIRDAVKLIRGKKGTVVKLTLKRPDGSIKTISITRDRVVLEEAYVKGTVLTNKKFKQQIGYITVPKFYRDFSDPKGRNCSTDVKVELQKFNKMGNIQAVILDLRNNGGGALEDARLMGGLFIDKGPIVQVKNSGEPQIHRDTDGKIYWDKPVIVLVNRFSASASEIVAGALKDYKRALIIGSSEQTHGKGTVQAIMDLGNYLNPVVAQMIGNIGALKITTDIFYRINGMSTQFKGIKPDIQLPDQFGYMESGERFLDHAIPYDEIAKLRYTPWKKDKYDIKELIKKSKKRVDKSSKFKKIKASVAWYKKRKDMTIRPLNLKAMVKYQDEAIAVTDKFKADEPFKNITVKKMKKLKTEDAKERFTEFSEGLKKDPVINETLNIINDILTK